MSLFKWINFFGSKSELSYTIHVGGYKSETLDYVDNPNVEGLPEHDKKDTIKLIKELTGRVVGINLEPVEEKAGDDDLWKMSKGRMATAKNAKKAKSQGADLIVITGNPGNHVTNKAICKAIKEIRKELGDNIVLITGKMHASGEIKEAGENIITKKDIKQFILKFTFSGYQTPFSIRKSLIVQENCSYKSKKTKSHQ